MMPTFPPSPYNSPRRVSTVGWKVGISACSRHSPADARFASVLRAPRTMVFAATMRDFFPRRLTHEPVVNLAEGGGRRIVIGIQRKLLARVQPCGRKRRFAVV